MDVDKININMIVQEVLKQISSNQPIISSSKEVLSSGKEEVAKGEYGLFDKVHEAIKAAGEAQIKLVRMCLERRKAIIEEMRQAVLDKADEIGKMSVMETGLGRIDDKIKKNILAAQKTPGIEDIKPEAYTGDHGFTLVEHAPYGVIGAITPCTNPSETVICNAIGMIAAGNTVVFNSHPAAKKVTGYTIQLLNRAIMQAGGPENLLCGVAEPTPDTGKALINSPEIRLMVVTGGPEIVRIAMNSGKKTIAAGPGNPPVVVDETANIETAARYIFDGASFDNNVLCIAEKEVFVVECVADQLLQNLIECGSYCLVREQLDRLMENICIKGCNGQAVANREYVGKDIQNILKSIGVEVSENIRLAIAEVPQDHPLVYMEQLMPVLPVVRVRNVNEAIDMAFKAEQKNYHTAIMHSLNIENLSRMAKTMNTSIFVKNAPSYAGLGMMGEGFTTYTIASPTGEGLTSPISFTRQRRCVLKDQFRII